MGTLGKIKGKIEKVPFYNTAVLPYHWGQALVAGMKYNRPAKKMTVIGVTGTNGKTTTCFMIWKMLNEAGRKAGLMTTVAWGVDELEPELNHMTTVDSMTLNKRIKKIAETGAEFLVLEVTSHAMAQFRTLGVPIEVAVMTNLTHEHLDYHKTFENYRDAKRKLFKKAKFGVVNADDAAAKWFLGDVEKKVSYGIKHGEVRAEGVKLGAEGVKYACVTRGEAVEAMGSAKDDSVSGLEKKSLGSGKFEVRTQIPGEFNVYNSLAAVCVGMRLGLTEEQIASGIASLKEVEGRMNKIDMGQDFTVIVDYAHTPDAIEKVMKSVEGHKGKIIAVHGGAGRRDETTRAERGEILAKYCDTVIITEDDSRDEDPEKIAAQFAEGTNRGGGKDKLIIELNRRKAIEKAIGMAKQGDLVLILGKGHEKTILRKDGAHEFEDIKEAKRAIKNRNK